MRTVKGIGYGLVMAALLLLLAACGGGPGAVAERFMWELDADDTNGALEMVSPSERDEYGDQKVLLALQQMVVQIDVYGGIDSIDTTEQVDGDRATVDALLTMNNGESQENEMIMVREGGAWRVSVGK